MAMNDDARRAARRAVRLWILGVCLVGSVALGLVFGLTHGRWRRPATVGEGAGTKPLPPPPPKQLNLVAVGDVMLDRGVWRRIRETGIHRVMAGVRPLLRAPDVTFANLECPLSTVQGHAEPGGDLSFCADPATVQALLDAGIDVVSLGNNHALDAGREGAEDTMRLLEANHIAYCGGRPQGQLADKITYLTVGDLTVAFLAYTDLTVEHAAMCRVDPDRERVLTQVGEARNQADVVVVSYHWGEEYEATPNDRQRRLGHATIEAGADLILGHHPHVLSGVEFYRQGLILYSMGNFVFDQRDAPDGRMTSAVFGVHLEPGRRIDLVITPVRIPSPAYAPRVAGQAEAGEILRRLAAISGKLGTPLQISAGKARASSDYGPRTTDHGPTARPQSSP